MCLLPHKELQVSYGILYNEDVKILLPFMFYDTIKRLFDIVAAIILGILFLPIWVIIPILIKLDSEGPVLIKQERIGKNSKKFVLYKFRSMRADADSFWFTDSPEREKAKKAGFKMSVNEDPRITKIGRIIRQTSIDEMPQILNIFKGEMSLVGPRPIREFERKEAVQQYGKKIDKIIDESLEAKPGITGPWQVSGRNDIPWNQRVAIDADYAKRKSILYDIYIMLKTPFAMISKW